MARPGASPPQFLLLLDDCVLSSPTQISREPAIPVSTLWAQPCFGPQHPRAPWPHPVLGTRKSQPSASALLCFPASYTHCHPSALHSGQSAAWNALPSSPPVPATLFLPSSHPESPEAGLDPRPITGSMFIFKRQASLTAPQFPYPVKHPRWFHEGRKV